MRTGSRKSYAGAAGARARDSLEPAVTELLEGRTAAGWLRQAVGWRLFSDIELDLAANFGELSLRGWDEDEEFPGADAVCPGGYDHLVSGLARGLTILYNHVVSEVNTTQARVRVTTEQGSFEADRVIVTLPLGVLKANRVRFRPELPPRKRLALERLAMGTLAKVVLRFARPFWPERLHRLATVTPVPNESLEFWSLLPTHGSPVLVALAAGRWARTLEQQPPREAVAVVVNQLGGMFGNDLPPVTGSLISSWQTDPFARGSYSHLPPGAEPADYDALAEPLGDRLYFAGEATHRQYPATVHGAPFG